MAQTARARARGPIAAGLDIHRTRTTTPSGDPFLRVGDAGRVLRVVVVADEPNTGVPASDHAGVLAEIVWPDRTSSAGT